VNEITIETLRYDGKTKHLTRCAAKFEIKTIRCKKGWGKLGVYKCDYCGFFHVGKSSKRAKLIT